MDIEERMKVLEAEFQITKEELRQILLDIRTFLMEVQTPLRTDLDSGFSARSDSEKGVELYGNG